MHEMVYKYFHFYVNIEWRKKFEPALLRATEHSLHEAHSDERQIFLDLLKKSFDA